MNMLILRSMPLRGCSHMLRNLPVVRGLRVTSKTASLIRCHGAGRTQNVRFQSTKANVTKAPGMSFQKAEQTFDTHDDSIQVSRAPPDISHWYIRDRYHGHEQVDTGIFLHLRYTVLRPECHVQS